MHRPGVHVDFRQIVNEADFLANLESKPDLVVASDSRSGFDAGRAIRLLRERWTDAPSVVLGAGELDSGAGPSRESATRFLPRDRLDFLAEALEHILIAPPSLDASKTNELSPVERANNSRSFLNDATDAIIVMDASGGISEWNAQAEAVFGWSKSEVLGKLVAQTIIPARYRDCHTQGLQEFLQNGKAVILGKRIEIAALRRNEEEFPVELVVWPERTPAGWSFTAFLHDITERKQAEALNAAQRRLLEKVASGAPLEVILSELIVFIESQSKEMIGSILLLDDDGLHARHIAAPNLPPRYIDQIDGFRIGPAVGSCGTAMYTRRPVIVSDISTDPLWAEYRELAAEVGLQLAGRRPSSRTAVMCSDRLPCTTGTYAAPARTSSG